MISPDTAQQGDVVVIEDDPAVRGVVALLLESVGWRVTEAGDGQIGLQLIESTRPDLVVTDLRLPGLSGIDVARRMARDGGRATPVIGITSDTSGLRDTAIESGRFVAVFTKPFEPEEFLESVQATTQV